MSGSQKEQEEVVRLLLRHQPMLSAYLFTLTRDWELAEEALQETSVYVCSHWQDYTTGTRFGAWARAVARLRLKEALRRKQRVAEGVDPELLAAPIPDEEWDRQAEFTPRHKAALSECLGALPQQHRRVVELHYHENRDGRFLANYLNKSTEAVYVILSRVRRHLRDCIEERMARAQG
jgi:RNA polymerase sigma-70 factor (ECF subfamily)